MLVPLKIGDAPRNSCAVEEPPAMNLLRACHVRIRSHLQLAERVLDPAGSIEARKDAGLQLARYFGIALPLHAEDEDVSLAQRVRDLAQPQVTAALETMEAEHVDVERHLGVLVPAWRALSETGVLPEPSRTAEQTRAFASLMALHLGQEEARIFPAMLAGFTGETWAEIHQEMKERRQLS